MFSYHAEASTHEALLDKIQKDVGLQIGIRVKSTNLRDAIVSAGVNPDIILDEPVPLPEDKPKKQAGRPKGSRNKPKAQAAVADNTASEPAVSFSFLAAEDASPQTPAAGDEAGPGAEITAEDVRAKLQELVGHKHGGGLESVKAVLAGSGYKKVSEVSPESFEDILADVAGRIAQADALSEIDE